MTRERLEALHALVGAVREWSNTPVHMGPPSSLTAQENRLIAALDAVEACGAGEALTVALCMENRRDAEQPPG